MIRHDAAMTIAATALDFPLSSAERARLDEHLASCTECTRGAHALRADAGSLADLPAVRIDPRHADAILARVLAPPAVGRESLRLVLVAALFALLALGSLAVGGELLRRANEKDLSVVPPQPAPSMPFVVEASPGPDSSLTPQSSLAPIAGIGLAWRPVTMPGWTVPDPGGATMNGVIAGGPGAIAWGWTYGVPSQIWTTADGMEWALASLEFPDDADPEYREPGVVNSIAAWGSGYVATGMYHRLGTGRRTLVWTSPDGRTWTPVPHDPVFEIGIMDRLVEWNGELLAFGHAPAGALGGGAGAQLWSSSDGVTWKAEDLHLPDGLTMAFAVAAGDRLWAYGATGGVDTAGDGESVLLTSTDGRTWDRSPLPRASRQLAAPSGGLLGLLRVGFDVPDSPGIYGTTDLETWQILSGDETAVGYDVIDLGGLLVMVGNDWKTGTGCSAGCHATGWRSTDGGRTWQAVPAEGPAGTMSHVAALPDGTLVAVGDRNEDANFPSPAAWVSVPVTAPVATPPPSPGPAASTAPAAARSWQTLGSLPVDPTIFRDVVGFDSGYVAVESGTKVRFSPDGVAWEAINLPFKETTTKKGLHLGASIDAVASDGPNVVVVGGAEDKTCTAAPTEDTGGGPLCRIEPLSWVSSDGRTWTKGEPVLGLTAPAGKGQGAEFKAVWAVPGGGWDASVGWWEGESLRGRDILHSKDGLTWSPSVPAPASTITTPDDLPWNHAGVADPAGRRLLWEQWSDYTRPLPSGGGRPVATLAMSDQGGQWAVVDGFAGDAVEIRDGLAPATDGPWLLAGQAESIEYATSIATVWASSDRRTWEAVPLPLGDMKAGHVEHLFREADGYLAVGDRLDDADAKWLTAWHSTDGRSWSLVDAATQGALADGRQLSAVGPAGTIAMVAWMADQEPRADVLRLR